MKLVIFLAIWGFFSGCKVLFNYFGKPNGLDQKYPLFLLTISLVALYALPMIFLTRYLAKRFAVSKSVVNLSWTLGLTANLYFSGLGQTKEPVVLACLTHLSKVEGVKSYSLISSLRFLPALCKSTICCLKSSVK